ncbi:MAG: ATP-dependent helicase [Prevotella sp.]
MKLTPYTKRKNDVINAGKGKSIVIDSAPSLYMQLEAACDSGMSDKDRYDIIRNVFRHTVEQAIADCPIAFVGFFSKVDYCIKEYKIPYTIANLVQLARKNLFPKPSSEQEQSDEDLAKLFPHNLKAAALLVYYVCGKEEIPESLKDNFPRADRKNTWGKFSENVLRVVVERWDEHYIWATEEENNTTLQICYDSENKVLTLDGKADWSYLNTILWAGAQLNLVRIRKDERGEVYMPELIILEPDYLVNITTIAACFESYAESPFVNLINKIKPSPNIQPIHLGNLSGQFLDDTIHDRRIAFEDSLKEFVNKNALNMISCQELIDNYAKFKEDARQQKRNIEKLIGIDLPKSIGEYDKKEVVLEPSFFSEVLGIQGRLDFLYQQGEDVIIIEQKSGNGEFVPYGQNSVVPIPKETHKVQLMLYRALFNYEFQKYAENLKHTMLLYSKYSEGLLRMGNEQQLLLRAIKMRNLIAWSEIFYAKEGVDILTTLTPEKLNQKRLSGRLWENYVKPQLSGLLAPIASASELERMYYLRFFRFLENEQLLAKVGNKQKEDSGFATIWNDRLEDKKIAGNIYDGLSIAGFLYEDNHETSVTGVKLRFDSPQSVDTTNFRVGDIVILYPYNYNGKTRIPNACAQMVHRASIVDMREDIIELRLRNSQTDRKTIENKPEGTLWTIEHDMFESMTGSLYSAMHSFLSAPKPRRDLLLSQRLPEYDTSIKRKGEYGYFNTLVEHAKQAKDLFLIIGPPGTGKTSYGLVNLLKEELLEEGANVLLLSYTNRAVDEICGKLVDIKNDNPDFDFIRIGSDLSCSKEYREYLLSSRLSQLHDGNAANRLILSTRVFCGTTAALNANMSLLRIKHFSLAIVDESSQILEPHLIGLLSAKDENRCSIAKFILIGDHKQLPAVVQQPPEESIVTEPELKAINLTDCRLSLFERLLTQFKTPDGYDGRFVYMLTRQGRMHKDIAEFPNQAFYGNKLDIVPLGHQQLANVRKDTANGIIAMLTTHRISFVAAIPPALSPSAKTNAFEARMIAATVHAIYELTSDCFEPEKTVGVIVPYRNQISTIRNEVDKYNIPRLHDITIDTVERYQGSQRDYIIYGFTIQQRYQLNFLTNNVFEEDGQIIDRKLNVAMTRARLGLVLIGNPVLLNMNFTFTKLMEFVQSRGGYFDVPLEDYCDGNFMVPHDVYQNPTSQPASPQ